jgi:hypothetical protein
MPQELTFVIDESGDLKFLVPEFMHESRLLEGAVVNRASHVEPDNFVLRIIFHGLRQVLGDKGRMSEFTRNWPILWRVNTKPVGGPILRVKDVYDWCPVSCSQHNNVATWRNRQNAIDAEIKFLNSWFIGEKQ